MLRLGAQYMRPGQPDGPPAHGRAHAAASTPGGSRARRRRSTAIIVRDPDGRALHLLGGARLRGQPGRDGRAAGRASTTTCRRGSSPTPCCPTACERRRPGRASCCGSTTTSRTARARSAPARRAWPRAASAQLMARAYHRTGDARFADAARGALAAFRVPVDRGGVVSEVAAPGERRQPPWYVERAYPGASPWKGAALNGFMVTLLNLRRHGAAAALAPQPPRDAARAEQRAPPAGPGRAAGGGRCAERWRARASRRSAATCRCTTPASWSLYGLLTPGLRRGARTSPTTATTATTSACCGSCADGPPGLGFGDGTYAGDYAARWAAPTARLGAGPPPVPGPLRGTRARRAARDQLSAGARPSAGSPRRWSSALPGRSGTAS